MQSKAPIDDLECPESICSLEQFCYSTKRNHSFTHSSTGKEACTMLDPALSAPWTSPIPGSVPCGEGIADEDKVIPKRKQLTLEDCVDMDVDTLTTLLERKFQALKSDTLDFFVDARTRFKTRALNDLNQERLEAETRFQTKCEELRLLSEELKEAKTRNKRLLLSLGRFSDSVALANFRKRTYRTLLTVLQSWYEHTRAEKRLKRNLQRALRHYCQEYQLRRVVVGWLKYVHEQNKNCARERFQSKLKVASDEIEATFNEKFALLEEENRSLREKMKVETEARYKLEEDMQQAFMRGVCALNMEALTVMKRGMPPNGSNPFYIDFLQNKTDSAKALQESTSDALNSSSC